MGSPGGGRARRSSLTGLRVPLCSGRLFVVQWDNVRLKDREAEGSFTFQAVLDSNGTVIFNYREVSHGFSPFSFFTRALFATVETNAGSGVFLFFSGPHPSGAN